MRPMRFAACISDTLLRRNIDFGEVDFCGIRVGAQPNPMFRTSYLASGFDTISSLSEAELIFQTSWARL